MAISRYANLTKVNNRLATQKKFKITEENVGDYNIITVRRGERLDNVAYDAYGDSELWYTLALINDLSLPFISDKMNLIIPKDIDKFINDII